VGAVKANIGHLEAAAGIAGVIKTALCLEHGELPSQPGIVTLNEHIPWERTPVRIPTAATPFVGNGTPAIAGISSFGFTGSNAHVILQASPAPQPLLPFSRPAFTKTHVLALSAKSEARLQRLALVYQEYLAASTALDFGDVCFTANTRRAAFDYRLAIEAADPRQARELLGCFLSATPVAGVFTRTMPESSPHDEGPVRLAAQWARGFPVDWSRFYPAAEHQLVDLPHTPFLRKRHWFAEPEPAPAPQITALREVPLLGRITTSPAMRDVVFETAVSAESPAWVVDHRVQDTIVIPGAAHLASACQAALFQLGSSSIAIEDVGFPRANLLSAGDVRVSQLVLSSGQEHYSFKVLSCEVGQDHAPSAWTVHAEGRVSKNGAPPLGSLTDARRLSAQWQKARGEDLYRQIDAVGIRLGPCFRWVRSLSWGANQSLGQLSAPENATEPYALHPGLIDSCFQMIAAAYGNYPRDGAGEIFVPFSIRLLTYQTAPQGNLWCHAWTVGSETVRDGVIEGGFYLFNDDGVLAASATGVRMQRAPAEVLLRSLDAEEERPFYEVAWRRLSPVAAKQQGGHGEWVVAGDRGPFAAQLKAALEGRGEGIVYLSAEGQGNAEADASAIWNCADLLEQVARVPRVGGHTPRLYVVTRGAQPAGGSRFVTRPDSAALWGLGRVLANEEPSLRVTLIDLDREVDDEVSLQCLLAEITSSNEETQIAYRNGERLGARVQPLRGPGTEQPHLRANATYLITGGSGGLGLAFCRWLVECGARRVVLASRRGATSETAELAAQLAQTGCELVLFAADLSQEADVAALLEAAHTPSFPLRGVLHCAGVLDNAPCSDLTPARFETVFGPKVKGALLLERATRDLALDFFVLFSSATSLLGSPGQGNYAAANAFIDALAHRLRAEGRPALSVNWGPWKEAGMAAAASDRQRSQWESAGVHPILAANGVRALGHLLTSGQTQTAVFPVDWPQFLSRLPGGTVPPLLSLLAPAEAAAGPSRSCRARLFEVVEEERPGLLLQEVRAGIAAVLALESAEDVDPDIRLFALGLDSIMALELKIRFERELGLHLPATLIFDYPTPRLLADYLFRELFGAEPVAQTQTEEIPDDDFDRIINEEYSRVMRQFDA
jgi:acyl transferase domain-containing protein/acyl carrier protein